MIPRFTQFCKTHQKDLFLSACLLLVATIGYNIGQIRALHKTPIAINRNADIYTVTKPEQSAQKISKIAKPVTPSDPRVVTSKKSKTKVYHHTWCSGAARIKEENKLWFETSIAAEAAGYSLAGNCPDL